MPNIKEVTINGKKRYRMTITLGYEPGKNGLKVQKRKDFYGKTKKEVEKKYQEFQKKQNLNLDDSTQYFGIMADRWIYNFLIQDTSLKETTIGLYVETWNKYVKPSELYHQSINRISAGVIQNFYNKLFKDGCPSSAIKTINKVMSRYYNYLVQNAFAPYNFTNTLSIPTKKKEGEMEITTWTDIELDSILHGFDKAQDGFRLRFLIVMATYTGMRISELLGLKYEDIKRTESGYIVKVCRQVQNVPHFETDGTKTRSLESASLKSASSYRSIPLNSIVVSEFKIHRAWHKEEQMKRVYRTDYIFTTNTGGLLDKKNADTSCQRYYKTIGVEPKGFHTYRHTFGTNLYKKGVPLITASNLLGHSDISVTAKYYIDTPEDAKRNAIELLANIV